jgi:hypothetical protein
MKSFTSFTSFLSLVFFFFATTVSTAQVNATAGFYTTGNPYSYSATAGMGNKAVVVLINPTTNQIRVSSYIVSPAGAVAWKSNIDFGSAQSVEVAMLSETRAVVARANQNGSHVVTIFDIHTSTGVLTKKGEWMGYTAYNNRMALTKLSASTFATIFSTETGGRMVTFSVNTIGSITKKSHKDIDGYVEEVDMVRLTDNRVLAAFKKSASYVKFVCFDIAAGTLVVTQKGHLGWNNSASKLSLAHHSSQRCAAFAIDDTNMLDVLSLNVNAAGAVTTADAKMNVRKPGTTDYLLLNSIDAQTIGTSPGKILLSAARSDDNLTVVPFSFDNGLIAAQTGGYYPNAPNVTQVSAGLINGNMMIGAFRQVEDGKYHIRSYKWD